jgi:hypothetical protein
MQDVRQGDQERGMRRLQQAIRKMRLQEEIGEFQAERDEKSTTRHPMIKGGVGRSRPFHFRTPAICGNLKNKQRSAVKEIQRIVLMTSFALLPWWTSLMESLPTFSMSPPALLKGKS